MVALVVCGGSGGSDDEDAGLGCTVVLGAVVNDVEEATEVAADDVNTDSNIPGTRPEYAPAPSTMYTPCTASSAPEATMIGPSGATNVVDAVTIEWQPNPPSLSSKPLLGSSIVRHVRPHALYSRWTAHSGCGSSVTRIG